MTDLLRRLAAATEPDPGVTDRLRARLSPPSPGALLRGVGEVDPGVVGRLQAGARARRATPRRGPLVVGGVIVALLAIGSITREQPLPVGAPPEPLEAPSAAPTAGEDPAGQLRGPDAHEPTTHELTTLEAKSRGPAASATRAPRSPVLPATSPSVHPPATSPEASDTSPVVSPSPATLASPTPTELALVSAPPAAAPPDPLASLRLPAGVAAEREGRRSTVRWEVGTLTAGLSAPGLAELTIVTREGLTRVEDGEVAVTRDRLGTRVTVRGGRALVACEGGAEHELAAAESVDCLPTRALGWLGRAEALHEAGAPLVEVLAATAAGRAFGAGDPAYGELVALEVDVLRASGDLDAARDAARLYPPGGPRAAEMSRLQKP